MKIMGRGSVIILGIVAVLLVASIMLFGGQETTDRGEQSDIAVGEPPAASSATPETAVERDDTRTDGDGDEPKKAETVQPGIVGVSFPRYASVGSPIMVVWNVQLPVEGAVVRTAVNYDESMSHVGDVGPDVSEKEVGYPRVEEGLSGGEPTERGQQFSTGIVVDTQGAVYFRIHAVLDDGTYLWTEEYVVGVQ